jgi:nucleotide-binding universal stress UspA family protein
MFRHFLVPTDGSELSQLAVDQALEMASEIGAKVTFFHVQPSFYGRPDVALYGEGLVLDPLLSEQFNKPTRSTPIRSWRRPRPRPAPRASRPLVPLRSMP